MKKLMLKVTFLIAIFCVFTFNAHADTIYGYTSFSGTFKSDSQYLNSAKYFEDFTNVVVSTGGGLNDYELIPGNQPVVLGLTTFVFDPDVTTAIPNFWMIDYEGKTYSYDLLTSEVDYATENSIAIKGTGLAHITGFDSTDSIWFLSATGAGDTSTFTLSTLVPPDFQTPSAVPEPTTMLLFGMGLLGVARLARKKN